MKSIIASILSLTSVAVMAQNLHTEITVDRTVLPDVREAKRPGGIVPTLTSPSITQSALTPAEYNGQGTLSPLVNPLPPVSWGASTEHTPYRGYVSAGYFPLYNVGANAGYRFVDEDYAKAGAWVQYNGSSYNGDIPYFEDALFTNHIIRGGINGDFAFSKTSTLSINLLGANNVIRTPYYYLADNIEHRRSYNQSSYLLNPKAKLSFLFNNIYLSFGGGWQQFKFKPNLATDLTGQNFEHVTQNALDGFLKIGVCHEDESTPWVGIDLDGVILKSNSIQEWAKDIYLTGKMAEAHVLPYVRTNWQNLNGHIGANVSIAKGLGESHIKIAPELLVEWNSIQWLKIYAHAHGGEYVNRMADIFEYNPYIYPAEAYRRSDIPVVVEGGFVVGPINGFELVVDGGYAVARDALLPIINIERNGYTYSTMKHSDFNCWNAGARMRYTYQSLATFEMGFKTGGSDISAATWYGWHDSAKWLFDTSLSIKPIEPLTLTVGFSSRACRKAIQIEYPFNRPSYSPDITYRSLGNMSNVNLHGDYMVSDQLTAFLDIENLLNNRCYLISGMPAQGLTGLFGIAYKF